jgi:hypothetical protein
VRQAGPGEPALVEEGDCAAVVVPRRPGLGDEPDLIVVELGERADVIRGVDDDLLALEGGVEVRDDADSPRVVAEAQDLRRSAVLAAGAERTAFELLLGRWLDLRQPGAGTVPAARGEDDLPTREWVYVKLDQLPGSRRSSSSRGLTRSIGSGRISVDDRSELISSIVWR